MRAADQFHVGMVVPDLGRAQAGLSDLLGYEWTVGMTSEVAVRYPDGPGSVTLSLVYSVTEPRVELVQEIPGTLWVPADSGVHHLGYWSDDVAADSAELLAAGYRHEVSGLDGDGRPYWAYHRSGAGPRIELVSSALRPVLTALWGPPAP